MFELETDRQVCNARNTTHPINRTGNLAVVNFEIVSSMCHKMRQIIERKVIPTKMLVVFHDVAVPMKFHFSMMRIPAVKLPNTSKKLIPAPIALQASNPTFHSDPIITSLGLWVEFY